MIYLAKHKEILGEIELRDLGFEKMFVDEIWKDGYYFANDFQIKNNDIVLDIGGHIGIFSILASKLGGNVTVYEPITENIEYLKSNLKRNKCDNVHVVPVAIGMSEGVTEFQVPNANIPERNTGTSGIIISKMWDNYHVEPVLTIPFARVLDQFEVIDFLKMDIEGMEYQLFYNLPVAYFKKIQKISMEFHFNEQAGRELETFFKGLGYTTFFSWTYGSQGRLQARYDLS